MSSRREPTPRPLTLSEARDTLRALGLSLTHTDGEYRVSRQLTERGKAASAAAERKAYYTNDLRDAVSTGRVMAAEAAKRPR